MYQFHVPSTPKIYSYNDKKYFNNNKKQKKKNRKSIYKNLSERISI